MKKIILLVAAAMVVMGAAGVQAAGKSGSAAQLFKAKCSACHSDAIALHMKKDRQGWESTVKMMQQKRPNFISDQDAQKIVNYLVSQSAGKKK